MVTKSIEIQLTQDIPDNKALLLNNLVRVDQATAQDRLGSNQVPTTRIAFDFNQIQDLLANGLLTQIPKEFSSRFKLEEAAYQLIHHPHSASLLWIGKNGIDENFLPIKKATITIEIDRERLNQPEKYTPHYLRIGVVEPKLGRPLGIAWSLIHNSINEIDITPSLQEFHRLTYGVGDSRASTERIPTHTDSYAGTFGAALITEGMIPNQEGTGEPLYRGVLKFRRYWMDGYDQPTFASNFVPYGFFVVEEDSAVIVGFQGGKNEFTEQQDRLVRPLPSWHISLPAKLPKI